MRYAAGIGLKTDLTYSNQLKSVAILEKLFEQNPQHPACATSSFILQTSRRSRTVGLRGQAHGASTGGSACRHMPSTSIRWGMWRCRLRRIRPQMESSPLLPAADFTVYAHRAAQDAKAKALMERGGTRRVAMSGGVLATSCQPDGDRYLLDRGDWRAPPRADGGHGGRRCGFALSLSRAR